MKQATKANWLYPGLLLLLGSLNIVFGALQLNMIQQGPPEVADEFTSMHYFEVPVPIVLHIVFGILFNLLGPLQFAPAILRKWPIWHRLMGRLLVISGFVVAFTALWMNQNYPAFGGALKYFGIATYSVGMILSLVVALLAILKRNVRRHKAWMMRAVAIGLAPATQRVFVLPIFFAYGMVSEFVIGLIIWGGLILNLLVVELVLNRRRRRVSQSIHTKLKEVL